MQAPVKNKKPSTEERRATHNAVERARRETLNEGFLDLARIIPSIAQHRKPSKALIINSSISYLHASRRHRALAARELMSLHAEAEQLRKEVNSWRDQAGITKVEEPIRSPAFEMVLRAELPLEDTANLGSEIEERVEVEYEEPVGEGYNSVPHHSSSSPPSPPSHLPPSPPYEEHGPLHTFRIYPREHFERGMGDSHGPDLRFNQSYRHHPYPHPYSAWQNVSGPLESEKEWGASE